jgi:secreted Zn-dependent insulinase-like peptidase
VFDHPVLNPQEENSALVFNLQIGPLGSSVDSLRTSLLSQLVHQLISSAAFHQLRTVEKLGYMVWAQPRSSTGSIGPDALVNNFMFIIQNPTLDPRWLEARVESFIRQFGTEKMAQLDEQEFNAQKQTLRHSLLQQQRSSLSMSENFAAVWDGKILQGMDVGTWDREEKMMQLLESLTKEQLQQFYTEKVRCTRTHRAAVRREAYQ